LLPNFLCHFWGKKWQKQQKPKKYVFDVFVSLTTSFSKHLVVNTLFKVKLLFKKNYIGTKCEKKEVEGSICFWVTWSPSPHTHTHTQNGESHKKNHKENITIKKTKPIFFCNYVATSPLSVIPPSSQM